MKKLSMIIFAAFLLSACEEEPKNAGQDAAGDLASTELPPMRWREAPNREKWNEAALEALDTHGRPLLEMVPADIDMWCPAYEDADETGRAAFWVGFLSALAKHESTFKPRAVNPNGKWFGLLQISPATAEGYGCDATSGEALRVGGENLSCAIRIMAVTVPRDGVIHANDGRWRGVAADWGPLRRPSKRRDIAAWTNNQPFCQTEG